MKIRSDSLTEKQTHAFGIVISLVLTAIGLFANVYICYFAVCLVLLILVTVPVILYPFAFAWYKLAELLSPISSKIILTIVFIVFVFPVGILRRLAGHDPLALNKFKRDNHSVLKDRNYEFTSKDLEHLF